MRVEVEWGNGSGPGQVQLVRALLMAGPKGGELVTGFISLAL